MSRAEIMARAEAEAQVADLEDQLVASKESGEATAELKLELRDARQSFRERRDLEV